MEFVQFSPNMLKTFELCPKKFYFKYDKKISMPVNDDIFEFGKNIHALASYYLRKENIYKMEQALSQKEKEVWEYLKSTKYFALETIETEYNLSVKVGNHFFGGRLDALMKDSEGKYFILDYKTGSAPKGAKYDYQTIIYLLCVNEFFKTSDISFVYLDLRKKEDVIIDFSEELKSEYEQKLINISQKIDTATYTNLSRKPDCMCEYEKICF